MKHYKEVTDLSNEEATHRNVQFKNISTECSFSRSCAIELRSCNEWAYPVKILINPKYHNFARIHCNIFNEKLFIE